MAVLVEDKNHFYYHCCPINIKNKKGELNE